MRWKGGGSGRAGAETVGGVLNERLKEKEELAEHMKRDSQRGEETDEKIQMKEV